MRSREAVKVEVPSGDPDIYAADSQRLYVGDLDVRFGEKRLRNLRLKDLNGMPFQVY